MSESDSLSPLELAALLCSRVCHDVISPVGAIANGLEVLEEDGAEDMREFAMDLIHKSARQASAKLQFARIAFGAAGSAGAEIDLGDAQNVAQGFMAGEKADLTWDAPRILMPKDKVKLLLNLILLAISAIPRGGMITVTVDPEGRTIKLNCSGANARIPNGAEDLINATATAGADAHIIQPIYTGMLARHSDLKIRFSEVGEDIVISAEPNS